MCKFPINKSTSFFYLKCIQTALIVLEGHLSIATHNPETALTTAAIAMTTAYGAPPERALCIHEGI